MFVSFDASSFAYVFCTAWMSLSGIEKMNKDAKEKECKKQADLQCCKDN